MTLAVVTNGTDYGVVNVYSSSDCAGTPVGTFETILSSQQCAVNSNNGVSSNKYSNKIYGVPAQAPGSASIKLYSSISSCLSNVDSAVQWIGQYQLNTCILDSGSDAKAFIYYCSSNGVTQRQFTTASSCSGSYTDNLFLPSEFNGYNSTCHTFVLASSTPIGAGYARGFCESMPSSQPSTWKPTFSRSDIPSPSPSQVPTQGTYAPSSNPTYYPSTSPNQASAMPTTSSPSSNLPSTTPSLAPTLTPIIVEYSSNTTINGYNPSSRRLVNSNNGNYQIPLTVQNAIISAATQAQNIQLPNYVTCNEYGYLYGNVLNVIFVTVFVYNTPSVPQSSTTIIATAQGSLTNAILSGAFDLVLQQTSTLANSVSSVPVYSAVTTIYLPTAIPTAIPTSSPALSVSNNNGNDGPKNLSDGDIAAIVICSFVGFVFILGLIYYILVLNHMVPNFNVANKQVELTSEAKL